MTTRSNIFYLSFQRTLFLGSQLLDFVILSDQAVYRCGGLVAVVVPLFSLGFSFIPSSFFLSPSITISFLIVSFLSWFLPSSVSSFSDVQPTNWDLLVVVECVTAFQSARSPHQLRYWRVCGRIASPCQWIQGQILHIIKWKNRRQQNSDEKNPRIKTWPSQLFSCIRNSFL